MVVVSHLDLSHPSEIYLLYHCCEGFAWNIHPKPEGRSYCGSYDCALLQLLSVLFIDLYHPCSSILCTGIISNSTIVLLVRIRAVLLQGGRTSSHDYIMVLRKVGKYFTWAHGFCTKYWWRARLGLGTFFDSTPVELYNGVNPMRKDSGIMEKQGLW